MSNRGEGRTACVHGGQRMRKRALWCVFRAKAPGKQKVLDRQGNMKEIHYLSHNDVLLILYHFILNHKKSLPFINH